MMYWSYRSGTALLISVVLACVVHLQLPSLPAGRLVRPPCNMTSQARILGMRSTQSGPKVPPPAGRRWLAGAARARQCPLISQPKQRLGTMAHACGGRGGITM